MASGFGLLGHLRVQWELGESDQILGKSVDEPTGDPRSPPRNRPS
jgi:hypothetical protein